jgi:hypothetical protein
MTPIERRVMNELARLAKAGERCPFTERYRGPDQTRVPGWTSREATALSVLARLGYIRIEIAGRNWRTIRIVKGEHAGLHTKEPPLGAGGIAPEPYFVIESGTPMRNSTRPTVKRRADFHE